MAVKHLNDYFDFEKFIEGKTFQVTDCKPHYVYVDGKKSDSSDGTSLSVIIVSDKQKNNKFSTFKITLIGQNLELDAENDTYIVSFKSFDGLETSIYGQFHNELSVKAGVNNIKLGKVPANEN